MLSNTRLLLVLGMVILVGEVYGQFPTCTSNNPISVSNVFPTPICADSIPNIIEFTITTIGDIPGNYRITFPGDSVLTLLNVISPDTTIFYEFDFECGNNNFVPPQFSGDYYEYDIVVQRTDCVVGITADSTAFTEVKATMKVIPNPVEPFTYEDPIPCSNYPFIVNFEGAICDTNLVSKYQWYVDSVAIDSLAGMQINLSHSFNTPGDHTVRFEAYTYDATCGPFSYEETIYIPTNPDINNISLSPASLEQLCEDTINVIITDNSQYIDTYFWSSNNGNVIISNPNSPNPQITIINNEPATYTIMLTAYNDYGCDAIRSFLITTFDEQTINLLPTTVCADTTLNTCDFIDFIPPPLASSVTWSSPNPDVTVTNMIDSCATVYIPPNIIELPLTVKGKNRCNQEFEETVIISITPSPSITIDLPETLCDNDPPINILDFVTPADSIASCNPSDCQFDPSGNIGENIITVIDSCGIEYIDTITVLSTEGFTGNPPTVCVGVEFDLSTLQSGVYTGNEVNDNIFFSDEAGSFNVQFTDTTACEGQGDFEVEVVAEPMAGFEFENSCVSGQNIFLEGQTINVNNTSGTSLIHYIILEENDTIETNTLPSLPPGNYTLQQTVGISEECRDSITQQITIEPNISATIGVEIDTTECDSIRIHFDAFPFNENYNYQWTSNHIEIENIPNPSIVIPRPNSEDSLVVNLTVDAACSSPSDSVTIPLPARFDVSFDILNTNDEACSEEAIYLQNTSINYDSIVIINEDGSTAPFPDSLTYINDTDSTLYIPIIIQGFSGSCSPIFDTLIVKILPPNVKPEFSLDYDTPACAPLTVSVTNSTIPWQADSRIYWGDGSTPQPIASGETLTNPNPYNFPRDTTITLMIVSRLCGVDTVYKDITIYANPEISFTYNTSGGSCTSDSIRFIAMGDVSQQHSVSWDFGDGNTSFFLNPFHSYDEGGIYNVTLTVTDSLTLCKSVYTDLIEIIDYTGPNLLIEAPTELCVNSFFDLNIINSSDTVIIDYGNGISTNTLIPNPYTEIGKYNLNVSTIDANGCRQDTSLWVAVFGPINANIIPDRDEITVEFGELTPLDFTVEPNRIIDKHIWEGDSIDNPDNWQINITPLMDEYYYLNVIDEFGCTAEDSILVRVNKNYCESSIFVPNVFSPNGDNINDSFYIHARPNTVRKINSFKIYNRWGDLVFEADNCEPNDALNCSWDGTYKGKPLNPAVFVWWAEIEFADGESFTCKGDVTLLR